MPIEEEDQAADQVFVGFDRGVSAIIIILV